MKSRKTGISHKELVCQSSAGGRQHFFFFFCQGCVLLKRHLVSVFQMCRKASHLEKLEQAGRERVLYPGFCIRGLSGTRRHGRCPRHAVSMASRAASSPHLLTQHPPVLRPHPAGSHGRCRPSWPRRQTLAVCDGSPKRLEWGPGGGLPSVPLPHVSRGGRGQAQQWLTRVAD